uniref:serine protease inhibitor A3K-like n=1 Tax=Gasterosteus aculeatus aculeatus TaxID=481459 RepID=UPI001A99F7B0|nr:serine protease inhibitor A3K-like [Gasterosteus aculeatus aculeatus]
MMRAAVGIWILSAVICVGRGHHSDHGNHSHRGRPDQDTAPDGRANSFLQFSIKTSNTLNDVLMEMGMTHMFGERADLSGISDGNQLSISEVVHQATLDVDEAGATAAAATGVGFIKQSFHQIPVLKFNRPFMVMITERNTDKVLFMGKIINPNL